MGKIAEKFGKYVSDTVPKNPKKIRKLLGTAYSLNGFYIKHFPDKTLLPHQQYSWAACNDYMVQPFKHPENSALVNIFMPCELFHAIGMNFMFAEGLAGYLNGTHAEGVFIDAAEDYGVPKTFCSYHKAMIGAALTEVLPKLKLVVNTTLMCDANNLTFRAIAKEWDVPHITIDVPYGETDSNIKYVADQLRDFGKELEKITGRKIEDSKLKEAMEHEKRSMENLRKFYEILPEKTLINALTPEMFKLFLSHVMMGSKEADRYFEMLVKDTEAAPPRGNEIRLMWGQVMPNWQKPLRDIFNSSDKYHLLASSMNFDAIIDVDVDRPYETMAKRLIANMGGMRGTDRLKKILEMSKKLHADGVIYFNHWGCKKTSGISTLAKNMFEKNGLPTLILDGDGCDRRNVSDEQVKTRVQAFLEILEAAK